MERNRVLSDDLTQLIPTEERMPAIEWLAEQMPGGFFIYKADESTELLYVNRATCDIFGCASLKEFRELTGNTFRGMVHPDDYDRTQTSIDDQIADSANRSHMDYVVYRIIRRDGAIRWVSDYGHFSMLPGYGEVYYVFIWDITDTRLAAEEKERSEKLEQALEAAKQASVAKTAFLSNMSHEIRTPITAILGMNEMIQREADDSAILDYSENIRKAGVSLLGIISDILDFSKIESGRVELENEDYDLASAVVDLYNLVQFRAEAKGLELRFEIDPELPSGLRGDEIRVKQIITNLLTNAVKYTEKGSVVFALKCLEKTADSVRIGVSVTDTGMGIRSEEINRLFEPFDRLNLKKTRTIEGSGLGLTITGQLLALMGSRLEVESTYGKGSMFGFELIQQVSDAGPVGHIELGTGTHDNLGRGHRQGAFTAPGMKLLVVDDTPMNLQVIAGLLKRTRMHIDVATSGAECIEKFGSNHYNLVFLDYRMPHMNGIETLEELKRIYPEKFEQTPIISLTASAVSGDKEKMLRAGFTDYLAKPVNAEEMERMLIKYLPPDSVVLAGEESEQDDELSMLPDIIFSYPELDPQKGIEYCGDADDYIFALDTYAMSIDAKAEQIEKDLSDGDIEAFTINVHSLKSTSQAIGAMGIFEKARALEMAGKEQDIETLKRDTPVLMKEYRNLKGVLKKILDKYEACGDQTSVSLEVVEEERNRMLARALSEAERANMAKTAFLSNVSHAIRTPMNSIIGLYNVALRNDDISDEMRDILSQIGASAKHLLSIVNDILDIGRIESGNMQLSNSTFSFGDTVEEINTMIEAQCLEKGLDFNCTVSGPMDECYIGDDMKLKQMMINILGNAVRYTPAPGQVTFTVTEDHRTDECAYIRMVVKDTGTGIDPEFLPVIFEPFSQGYELSGNGDGGTGLGMAITRKILDMMGGDIRVVSEKGNGTEFTVTVPLGLVPEIKRGEHNYDTDSIRTLIVDDDISACEHARMVLSAVGIDSDYVQSGPDALAAIGKQREGAKPYRLILIDWKMPGMDGIELTRAIRSQFEKDDCTIILTTYNWDDILEEALEAGVDRFLPKPLFASALRQELELLKIHKTRRSTYTPGAAQSSLAGTHLLLAEDVEINARVTQQILQMRDVITDYVANGEEALTAFADAPEGTYDAILMDIRMPVMDGLEATRRIRAMDRTDARSIPIIALTANAFVEDVELSLEAGMNEHLSKPVEPDALFATLEEVLHI